MEITRLVDFPGHGRFWLLDHTEDHIGGTLAPLEHCDEKGNVKLSMLDILMGRGIGYAQVFDGKIWQYGKVIGLSEDLVPVKQPQQATQT